jgi:BNR/Asp-box repeat
VTRLLLASLLPWFGCTARALEIPQDGGGASDGGFDRSGDLGAGDLSPFAGCTSQVPSQPTSWQTATIPTEFETDAYPAHRVRGDESGAVVVGTNQGLWTTADDGQTFTMFDAQDTFAEVAYGGGRFIALPYSDFEEVDQSYTSTDHGQTWSKFAKSDQLGLAQGLSIDGTTIYLADEKDTDFEPGAPATAFVSHDDGHSWQSLAANVPPTFVVGGNVNTSDGAGDPWSDPTFFADGTLYLTGSDQNGAPMVVRSSDGGQTFASWTYAGPRVACSIASLWAHDQAVVLLLTCVIELDINSVAVVLYSTDGGATFAESSTPVLPVNGNDDGEQWFWREVNGNARGDIVAVGDNGVALYSNDGGATFTSLAAPTQGLDMISSAWVSACGAVYLIAPNTGTFYAGH